MFFRETGELLLDTDNHFSELPSNDETISTFNQAISIAVRNLSGRDPDEYLFTALGKLLTSQWSDPTLNKIMNGEEVDADVGL